MKKLFAVTLAAVLLAQTGCSDSGPTQFSSTGAYNNAAFIASIETYAKEELTEDMEEGLLFMREEEKLARDVYIALGNKWNLRVMNNIAQSEQRHMDAVKILLDRYNLEDPAENNPEGGLQIKRSSKCTLILSHRDLSP